MVERKKYPNIKYEAFSRVPDIGHLSSNGNFKGHYHKVRKKCGGKQSEEFSSEVMLIHICFW